MSQISIVIADDHEIFRNGVNQLINAEEDMQVVGIASDGTEAISICKQLKPDVVIMDISMPNTSGLEACRKLFDENRQKVLILSLYDKEEYITSALKFGAMGYILKDSSNKIFLKAIRAVAKESYYFIGEVSDVLVRKFFLNQESAKLANPPKAQETESVHLSKRELEILRFLAEGINNKELAEQFGISIRTIETHRLNIMRKFQVNSIESAVEEARKQQII